MDRFDINDCRSTCNDVLYKFVAPMKYHKRKHFHSIVFIIGDESVLGTSDAPARRKMNDTLGPNSEVRN